MKKAMATIAPATLGKPLTRKFELVYAPHNLLSLRAAIDHGADCVRLSCATYSPSFHGKDLKSANNYMAKGIQYAHANRCKATLALEGVVTSASDWTQRCQMIEYSIQQGVDGLIFNDPTLTLFTNTNYPNVETQLSVANNTINRVTPDLYQRRLGVKQVILPRVLSMQALKDLTRNAHLELEVYVYGKSCALLYGQRTSTVDAGIQDADDERYGSIFEASNDEYYAIDASPDLNALALLPQLAVIGITAVQIEAYARDTNHTAQVVQVWREAIDQCFKNIHRFTVKPSWIAQLNKTAKLRKAS